MVSDEEAGEIRRRLDEGLEGPVVREWVRLLLEDREQRTKRDTRQGARPPRPTTELVTASRDLSYELGTLTGLAHLLASAPQQSDHTAPAERLIHSALMESFLIHSRAVVDFYYSDAPAPEHDCIADDFAGLGESWVTTRPPLAAVFNALKHRVSIRPAQLTYTRQAATRDESWPFLEIADGLLAVTEAFLGWVPLDHIDRAAFVRIAPGPGQAPTGKVTH